MKLEEKIALLRKQRGWSQEELAYWLDVSRQSVSKWEMGASVPDLDKILKLSEVFGCTTDYLLKEEIEDRGDPVEAETPVKTDKAPRQVCDEEGRGYIALVRRISWRIALGVALCVLSPTCMFLLEGLGANGALRLGQGVTGGVGLAVLLLVAAGGVAFLVVGGMTLAKYDYLEKEEIEISEELRTQLYAEREGQNRTFVTAITVGVVICILSVVPLMLSAAYADGASLYATAAIFPIAATGVFLFVRFGMVHGSYSKLLQENEYTPEKKREAKKADPFAGVYWCLTTALYLFLSFWTNAWHKTWIVWPVAGVLFAALEQLVRAIVNRKK